MTADDLLKEEQELEADFAIAAKREAAFHHPVTDGVVDAAQYLASELRILWILKEPWEDLGIGEIGGDWSVAKHVAAQGVTSNRGALARMAYVTYSVFNAFPLYEEMDWATSSAVSASLRKIAFINIKKFPGGKSSYEPEIAQHYQKNRSLLQRQIDLLAPHVIVGGNTLHHFADDLRLDFSRFNQDRSAWFQPHEGRLFIHAYHPACRRSSWRYVDEIVSIIREQIPC